LPTRADQWVVIRTKLLEKKGRKVVVGAEMQTLDGETLADAKCVFCRVSPSDLAACLRSASDARADGLPLRFAHQGHLR
jgi:acyl-CoA thioesterase FadM